MLLSQSINAQVGIGTRNPNTSAQLDLVSSSKGLLIPRVELKNENDFLTIANGNVESLLVYNLSVSSNLVKAFYYWSGKKWEVIMNESLVRDLLSGIGLKGDSAFQVWKSQGGNSNKNINDYFEYIKGDKGDKGASAVVIDNLTSTSLIEALSANQGRVLKRLVDVNSAKKQSYLFTETFLESGRISIAHTLSKRVTLGAVNKENFKVTLNGSIVLPSKFIFNSKSNSIKIIGIDVFQYDSVTVVYETEN